MTLLDDVHAALDADGVPHALIGAAALLMHGVSRSSLDIDLLATDGNWTATTTRPDGDVRC